jgi:hypothetical protein
VFLFDSAAHNPTDRGSWQEAIQEYQSPVEKSHDPHDATALKCGQGGFDDSFGAQAGQLPEEPAVVGKGVHLGSRGSGTDGQDSHARAFQLFGKRFGERKNERFCGSI